MEKIIENNDDYENNFNENEFLKLIQIQKQFLISSLENEKERFQTGLDNLNDDDKKYILLVKTKLLERIDDKINNWLQFRDWENGLVAIKDIFCLAHYSSFLPVIYKHYNHKTPTEIEYQYTAKSINSFLLKKYPHLKMTLQNISKHYIGLRQEYKKIGLSLKLGYIDIPNHSRNYIPLSIVRQLLAEIKKIRTFSIKAEKIKELQKSGLNQPEIAKELKITQPYVSYLIKKHHGGRKMEITTKELILLHIVKQKGFIDKNDVMRVYAQSQGTFKIKRLETLGYLRLVDYGKFVLTEKGNQIITKT